MPLSSFHSTVTTGVQRIVVQSALNNSGVMRHSLNANVYANHGRPGLAIREGAAAIYDAITGSRK